MFVSANSIVRRIWGDSDTILFIFAGAAAEFALNKAVDWLYFTNRLPSDPIGRLFSTVAYAKAIIFSEEQTALRTIDGMASIHANVEAKRNLKIPDWAYRDVLFMLIDYSIRSFDVLERKMTDAEKDEVFVVFNKVGVRMGLKGLPENFRTWQIMREQHLQENIIRSRYTDDLFIRYRKHLGFARYKILLEAQMLVVPGPVRELLGFRKTSLLYPVVWLYKICRAVGLDWVLKELILPGKYKKQIKALNS